MKAIQQLAMPDTLSVVSYTSTSDSMGGYTSTSSAGSCAGRISVASLQGGERVMADRLGVDKLFWITLPHGTTITEKCKIVFGSRTFEVVSISKSSYSTAVRCLCREME